MQWTNTKERFGAASGLFHWTSAICFIIAYIVVCYVIFVLHSDRTNPLFLPVLNVHWVLGIIVGVITVPRFIWRLMNVRPKEAPGSHIEHVLSKWAHWGLYVLLIAMPATGYFGTGGKTSATIDFYLFEIPRFPNSWLFRVMNPDWATFEPIMDAMHYVLGYWATPAIVILHIVAAFWHHFVRHDTVLTRMLPESHSANQ